MRRDELVDGATYLIRNEYNIFVSDYLYGEFDSRIEGHPWSIDDLIKFGYEWARINPEEIFKEKT